MVLGKAKDALADMAQTIRRLFGEPRVSVLAAPAFQVPAQRGELLAVLAHPGLEPPTTQERTADLFQGGRR